MEEYMTECKLDGHDNLENFIQTQLKLLEIEREAEIEENKCLQENASLKSLQEKGLCVPKLRIAHTTSGLFGRTVIKFLPSYGVNSLPSHTLSSGDIVGIGNVNSDGRVEVIISGVISSVHESHVNVALEKDSDASELEDSGVFNLIKLANDVTYRRLKRILKTLEHEAEKLFLTSVLFGSKSPSTIESTFINNVIFYNEDLNDTQKEAVRFALSQKEVAILHGPPGTGKTTTLVECILQSVSQKLKVIACAPSNVAVDNLVEKLAAHRIKIVRLGHPARVLSGIQKYSLDAIMSQYEGCDVIQEMQAEISKLKVKIENTKGSKKLLWTENKKLLKEMANRQKGIMKDILMNADVVLSTLTSASEDGPLKHVGKDHFDVCFIDECSQALEVACWIPLALVKKCVIAGDHNQLPPTIISEKAAKEGFSITLMERLLKLHGNTIKMMLTLQYRMHEIIMQWPSQQLYNNQLVSHESVRSHLLSDLPNVENNEDTSIPLLLIDTAGCDLYESQTEDEESKGNEGEADLVSIHIENMVKSGVNPSDIAVITPYNLQVDFIKSRCSGKYHKLEIKSVDGFQGREKEAVILSLVRSNDSGEIGFLSEDRRINVAITRAKRHLAVVCNTTTISHSNFLKSFISYSEENGEVRSAFQYENQIGHYTVSKKNSVTKVKQQVQTKPKKKEGAKGNFVSSSWESSKQQKRLVNEIDRFPTEQKYRQIIEEFIKSNKYSFSFSPELSAFERRVVHEISDELGIIHVSQGEGAERCIIISKEPAPNATQSVLGDDEKVEDKTAFSCGAEKKTITQKSKAPKEQKLDSKQSSKLKTLSFKQNSEEDFDALISAVIKADKSCSFEKCKKSIAVLSQDCRFCRGHFCFSHFIPEAHGCGHLAKAHARSQIRKDGVLYAGSGKPEKKVDPVKHSYLQKKLNEKIVSLNKQRKSKAKS